MVCFIKFLGLEPFLGIIISKSKLMHGKPRKPSLSINEGFSTIEGSTIEGFQCTTVQAFLILLNVIHTQDTKFASTNYIVALNDIAN